MYDVVREAFISGLAVVVPLVITVAVFLFLFNAVYGYLNLFSEAIVALPIVSLIPEVLNVSPATVIEAAAPVVVFGAVLGIGLVVNSSRYGERAVEYFDYVMVQIPGVGSVYESFRRMSDVVLESDAENFREVKLVEFPHEGAYTIGFVTTETPEVLRSAAGHEEMYTLFLPLAPNPVMGGHLVHLPESRVMDVEMSVEEGVQAIVTSGVAMTGRGDDGLSPEELNSLSPGDVGTAERDAGSESESDSTRSAEQTDGADPGPAGRYDDRVDPEHAETPRDLVRRAREHRRREGTDADSE
jgi:uncharacterized membrane protein